MYNVYYNIHVYTNVYTCGCMYMYIVHAHYMIVGDECLAKCTYYIHVHVPTLCIIYVHVTVYYVIGMMDHSQASILDPRILCDEIPNMS